jgi:hypothetical protein
MVTFVAVTLANQFYEEFLDVPAFTRRVLISREINAVKPIGHFRVLKIAAKRRKERKKTKREFGSGSAAIPTTSQRENH